MSRVEKEQEEEQREIKYLMVNRDIIVLKVMNRVIIKRRHITFDMYNIINS